MNQVTKFDGTHEDLIHDVAFNYYGNRLGKASFFFYLRRSKNVEE